MHNLLSSSFISFLFVFSQGDVIPSNLSQKNNMPTCNRITNSFPSFAEVEDDVQQAADAINVISLEEVQVPDSNYKGKRQSRGSPTDDRNKNKKSTGCYPKSNNFAMKRAKELTQGTSGKYMMQPAGASEDIVRSGHIEYATLWASNDSQIGRQPVTVNVVNAPNNSTLQCGCENISCPFCNLMLSIERTDPSVLQ